MKEACAMKKLFHIVATPRDEESRTLQVSRSFLEAFTENNHDWTVDELRLFGERLPPLTAQRTAGKYALLGGRDLPADLQEQWQDIHNHINRFLSADAYLISTPMWNFTVPYVLKQYIDVIVQPRYLFQYTEGVPEGLVKDRKMVVITSRGGEYTDKGMKLLDIQEPYLRTVFGFVGITDVTFIHAQPMDAAGPEVRRERLLHARERARNTAATFSR